MRQWAEGNETHGYLRDKSDTKFKGVNLECNN